MSTSLIRGVDPNGQVRTVAVSEKGEIQVTGISGGGGGGGSGTEYTEGEVDASITGTAVLWEDTGNTLRTISKDTPLPVTIAGLLALLDELETKLQSVSDRFPNALIGGRLPTVSSLEASENFLGAVGGRTIRTSAVFTRPADTIAYTAGDGISNSTTAPTATEFPFAARIAGGSGLVIAGKLTKSSATTTNASFRLWLYSAAPTTPNDNAAFAINFSNRAIRLGYIDFSSMVAGGDCAESFANPQQAQIAFKLAAGSSLYGILQAMGAYSPASLEQFYLDLSILQD